MSVNKVNSDNSLTTIANGSRIWVGTKAVHDLNTTNGTMPNNCLVSIIDDYKANEITLTDVDATKATVIEYRAKIQGDIIICNIRFNIVQTIAATSQFIQLIVCSGFPVATSSLVNTYSHGLVFNDPYGNIISGFIDINNNLIVTIPQGMTIPANTPYKGTIVYLK